MGTGRFSHGVFIIDHCSGEKREQKGESGIKPGISGCKGSGGSSLSKVIKDLLSSSLQRHFCDYQGFFDIINNHAMHLVHPPIYLFQELFPYM